MIDSNHQSQYLQDSLDPDSDILQLVLGRTLSRYLVCTLSQLPPTHSCSFAVPTPQSWTYVLEVHPMQVETSSPSIGLSCGSVPGTIVCTTTPALPPVTHTRLIVTQ
jgi:hypothetical protein